MVPVTGMLMKEITTGGRKMGTKKKRKDLSSGGNMVSGQIQYLEAGTKGEEPGGNALVIGA